MYGNPQLNLITIKTNLENFIPKGQHKYERVIQLYEEVEKGMDQLRVINATHTIAEDFQLVAALVGKLPLDYQEEWDKAVIGSEELGAGSPVPLWSQFDMFLKEVYKRSNQAKLRSMSAASKLTSSSSMPQCSNSTATKPTSPPAELQYGPERTFHTSL